VSLFPASRVITRSSIRTVQKLFDTPVDDTAHVRVQGGEWQDYQRRRHSRREGQLRSVSPGR